MSIRNLGSPYRAGQKEEKYLVPVVDKNSHFVRHLPKDRLENMHTIISFLCADGFNVCSFKVTGNAVNEEDGKGMGKIYMGSLQRKARHINCFE